VHSRMTKRGQFQEHANKTVNLVKGLLIRLMAWGCGGIGNASIATLLKDLRERRIFSDPRLDGVVFTGCPRSSGFGPYCKEKVLEPTRRWDCMSPCSPHEVLVDSHCRFAFARRWSSSAIPVRTGRLQMRFATSSSPLGSHVGSLRATSK
jgi:hypothetical protein